MSSTLSHLSESGKLLKQERVNELFSTLRFSVKHGGSVSVTARQQMLCASNLEQGDSEVPSPSVLRKAKLWNDSRNCWRNAGETLA